MDSTTEDDDTIEIVDLGDAAEQTRQVWFGARFDSVFGAGWFSD